MLRGLPGLQTVKEPLRLAEAITAHGAPGPLVLVGNEIGLGVIPMGREVRAFVDVLGSIDPPP